MGIYFTLRAKFKYFIYLSNYSSFGNRECLQISLSLWHASTIAGFFFLVYPYFLVLQNTPDSSCVFPVLVLESTTSSRSPAPFYWRMVSESEIWIWPMLIVTGPPDYRARNTYMYIETQYIHLSINISTWTCVYIKTNMTSYQCL